MLRTFDDLATAVLQRLGEIGDGQPPSPEAAQKVRVALPDILAELLARGVYTAPAAEKVEDAALRSLSAIVASELSDDFGLEQTDAVTLASRAQVAVERLREMKARPYVRRPQCVDYF